MWHCNCLWSLGLSSPSQMQGTLRDDAIYPFVCLPVCLFACLCVARNAYTKRSFLKKTKQFRSTASILTTNRKSCVGFSKNPFLNPLVNLERQQTSPRDPQQRPVKNFTFRDASGGDLRGVFSDNSTQLNPTDPVEQRTAKSVVFLFMTSRPTN